MSISTHWREILLSTVLFASGIASPASATVTATLDPQQVSVGEPAELTVSVSGSNASEPAIPKVDGLEITPGGSSSQIQMINGAVSASTSYTYSITAKREGAFTIPAIKAGDSQSQPLTLRVSRDPASPNNSKAYGFILLNIPKKEFYTGEFVPVEVKACVPNGVQASLNALPTLSSEAFALNALGNKAQRAEEVIEGRSYIVLTWRSAMTAVKAGDYSLSMELPITVVVRERRTRSGANNPFDAFMNDPFFNGSLFGRRKVVTLVNEPAPIKVLPLPSQNRPANFGGAIGSFEIAASAKPQSVAAGDPVSLKLTVTGKGNFDRVSSDLLAGGNSWKTYPPKSTFQPADNSGYEGAKTFEQLVIPTDPGVKQIPALTFSYFDPDRKQYITRTAAPIPLQVIGATAPPPLSAVANSPAPTAGAAPAAPVSSTANPLDSLVPNKIETGPFVASLRPMFLRPWFIATQGLPLLLMIGGIAYLRRKHRLATDPKLIRWAATQRAIQAQLTAMDDAMKNHQTDAFFTAARRALQQRLGERWSIAPDAVTLEEVRSRMNGEAEALHPLFEMADHVSYSGQSLNEADFRHWKDFVTTQLKCLENQP